MTNLSGTYYNGLRPIGLHAEMKIDNMGVVLTAGNIFERYSIYDVIVSPRIGSAPRFINLPNGSQFECKNHDILDTLPQESPTEGPVAWLEKRWPIAFVSVIMVFFLLALGYFFGLPAAAKHIVERIPIETEQSLGINAVAWLDKNGFLKPTNLGNNTQNEIIDGFKKLCKDLPFQKYYSLSFRSGILGPNALAFPGGVIIITDEMVKIAESNEEILAVLAHEIGHVELRHAMRNILQKSVVAISAASVTADATSLSAAVASLPLLLAQTKYSREFEYEADDFAFQLLKKNGYSPAAFASILERVANKHGKNKGLFVYVSSHPGTSERVQRARNAANY